jgi:hypothetical protein
MYQNLFSNIKTENHFLSQCAGWVKEINDFDNYIKSNQFFSQLNDKGILITLVRDDSYYTTFRFELNLGFSDNSRWRNDFEDNQIKNIEKVITDFEFAIKKLTIICTHCGSVKDEAIHLLDNTEMISKDNFFYNVTVGFGSKEICHTCCYLFNRDEYNIHLLNLSGINNNEFITPENNHFVNTFYGNTLSWPIIKSPLKVRIINQESSVFEYLMEKSFIFYQEMILYKNDFTEFSVDELNHLSNVKGIKKGIYAGQNTGFKDAYAKEIFTGDVLRFEWNNVECCGVVSCVFNRKEFHVFGNWWSSSLSGLSKMEIVGNIFFDLDKNTNVNIVLASKNIGEYGFEDCRILNEVNEVRQFLLSKHTPSFKRKKWFKLF